MLPRRITPKAITASGVSPLTGCTSARRTITGTSEAAIQCEELAEVQFTKLLNREAFADASNKTDPLGTSSSLPWQDETYY